MGGFVLSSSSRCWRRGVGGGEGAQLGEFELTRLGRLCQIISAKQAPLPANPSAPMQICSQRCPPLDFRPCASRLRITQCFFSVCTTLTRRQPVQCCRKTASIIKQCPVPVSGMNLGFKVRFGQSRAGWRPELGSACTCIFRGEQPLNDEGRMEEQQAGNHFKHSIAWSPNMSRMLPSYPSMAPSHSRLASTADAPNLTTTQPRTLAADHNSFVLLSFASR